MRYHFIFSSLFVMVVVSFIQQTATDRLLKCTGVFINNNILLEAASDTIFSNLEKSQVKMLYKAETGNKKDQVRADLNNATKCIDEDINKTSPSASHEILPALSTKLRKIYKEIQDAWKPMCNNIYAFFHLVMEHAIGSSQVLITGGSAEK